MRVIYMGTPDFAVPALNSISKLHNVVAVFTQPDKPVGRKQILTPPDVKVAANKLGITVYQPNTLKSNEVKDLIESLSPDIIVVAAYGKILPKEILNIPQFGCINIHASLLPKYRGAAPIQWSIINGDESTGITIMEMAEGLDTGDILIQEEIKIDINDTGESLFDKLSKLGADIINSAIDKIVSNQVVRVKQDDSLSTYAQMLNKSISLIDFNQTAFKVHKLVCGLYSWPIAHTIYKDKKLKIFKTRITENEGNPGEIISSKPLIIGCREGSIEVLELQLEGSKRMDSASFILGHKMQKGDVLG